MLLSKAVSSISVRKNDQQIWNHFWNFEKSVPYKEWRFITQKLHNYDETCKSFKMFPWKAVVSYEENSAPGYKRSKGQLTILFSCNITGKHKLKFSFIVKLKTKPTGLQKYSSNDTSSMVQQLKMQLNRLRNFLKIFYWIFPTVKSFLIKKIVEKNSDLTTLTKRNLRVTDGGEILEKLKKWNLRMLFTGQPKVGRK